MLSRWSSDCERVSVTSRCWPTRVNGWHGGLNNRMSALRLSNCSTVRHYTQTHRHTDRHTDTYTDRQTHTHRDTADMADLIEEGRRWGCQTAPLSDTPHRHTDTYTQRQTHTQTHTQTHKHRDNPSVSTEWGTPRMAGCYPTSCEMLCSALIKTCLCETDTDTDTDRQTDT